MLCGVFHQPEAQLLVLAYAWHAAQYGPGAKKERGLEYCARIKTCCGMAKASLADVKLICRT